MVKLSVAVLGPLEVRVGATPVESIPRKERMLLQLLALDPARSVMLHEIVGTIWPDVELRSERKSTQVLVYRLRRRLEEAGAPEGLLTTSSEGEGYSLALEPGASDLAAFQRTLARSATGSDPQVAVELVDDALGLWRGDPLPDLVDTERGRAERARLVELRREAEEDRADAKLAMGQHLAMVGELEAAIGAEPLRERRWGQLMVALYRSGRQADALRAYQRVRDLLTEELGIEPGADLRRLEQAIIAQDDDAAVIASRFTEAERVSSSSAATAPDPVPRLDPVGADRTGRRGAVVLSDEVSATVDHAIATAAAGPTLLTIVGREGVGKSTLLGEVADRFEAAGGTVLGAERGGDPEGGPTRLDAPLGSAAWAGGSLEEAMVELTEHGPGAGRPSAVLVDDLHQASAGVVEALQHLAETSRGAHRLVVLAYRDDEARSRTELLALLSHLSQRTTTFELELVGLGAAQSAALFAALLEQPGTDADHPGVLTLAHEAGGNPRHVVELARHLRTVGLPAGASEWTVSRLGIPSSIRHDVRHRLRGLQDQDLQVVNLAAVVGLSFDPSELAAVDGLPLDAVLDALDRTCELGLAVADDDGRFSFSSLVVRHAIYDDLPAGRRLALHGRLADAMAREASSASDDSLAAAADHLARSRAQEGAHDVPSPPEVLWDAHQEVMELSGRPPADEPDAWCTVLLGLATARSHSGQLSVARDLFHQCADEARQRDLPLLLARAAVGVGRISREMGVLSPTDGALLEEACAVVGDDDPLARRLREELMFHLMCNGRWKEAISVSEALSPGPGDG